MLIQAIVTLHSDNASRAISAVNRALVLRNWLIGAYLVEFEQRGVDRAEYSRGLLQALSIDLAARGLKGVSADMLERMRLFFRRYPQVANCFENLPAPISAPLVRKSKLHPDSPSVATTDRCLRFTWTQLADLVRIQDPLKRSFYEVECLNGNWSKRQLQRQIGTMLYERTALSANKNAVLSVARDQAPGSSPTASDLIRDPYVLEFIGLAERAEYSESHLEKALLDHLQAFLLELGTGFCFEARQKRVTLGNEHDYIDLVFYNRRLRSHLLIDLKVRPFQHADVGQMNFYLNYWKSNEMSDTDNQPIGLLLCSDKNQTKVQYASAGLDQQLFVSRYLVELPKAEHLQNLLERDRAALELIPQTSSVSASQPPSSIRG